MNNVYIIMHNIIKEILLGNQKYCNIGGLIAMIMCGLGAI